MTNEEKIKKIQYVLDHPGPVILYYKLLEDMGDIKYDYRDYLITNNGNEELKRLPEADYELSTALLTMILRADYFCEGIFEELYESGKVNDVLERMIETLKE